MNQRPELLPPCFENIPAELRAHNQWVVWRAEWEEKPDLPGGGRWNKIPHNAANGQAASSTDPQTWSGFETAVNAYKTGQGRYAGVGFVLHKGDSIVGIDLDHAIDENGNLTPEAAHFVAMVNGYTEISPSATGVRIFVRAILPPGGRKRGNVEMYETGRFLTVTGQHLPGTPENVPERQAEVEAMHALVWPPQPADPDQKKRARTAAKEAATNLPQSDADLLELAYRASRQDPRALQRRHKRVPRPERSRPCLMHAARLLHRR
jgi:primase-polymerase (primpol)-like protein